MDISHNNKAYVLPEQGLIQQSVAWPYWSRVARVLQTTMEAPRYCWFAWSSLLGPIRALLRMR